MKYCLFLLFALVISFPVPAQDSGRKTADTVRMPKDSILVAGNSTRDAGDSTRAAATSAADRSDDGFGLLFLVMLIGFVAVLCAGVAASVILFGVAVLLTLGGILSISVIMGIYNRSLKTGVRWAVFLLFGVGGAGAGVLSYFIFLLIRKLHFHISTPVLISAGAGLIGGLVCGAIFLMLLRRSYNYLQNRLRLAKKPA